MPQKPKKATALVENQKRLPEKINEEKTKSPLPMRNSRSHDPRILYHLRLFPVYGIRNNHKKQAEISGKGKIPLKYVNTCVSEQIFV